MPNSTQTRTVLNDRQFQILSAALHKVAPQYSNAYVMLTILQAFYQTDEAVAQLVIDTGLTSAQVRNWFNHRRRVLREKEFERRRIATKQHRQDNKQNSNYVYSCPLDSESSSEIASKSLCPSSASSQYSTSKPTLPPISSMFPEIFNSEYDYTLPPHVHPIELPAHVD
ncbi:uncharacterized protein C8R40DRAFT_1065884 [Lentinula edodes]|uniref:uncharacterized protein n=1 Tax=Lentinula edodes TaxID=5353 RepID=UPI001E8D5083|nr:uncharacterized protein C8R40DRAFT_1065884 [Lentinula edodes]KAH7879652.1 hypothetical protein C8R40DRAFT_1065884 [Lentinula edodes]